MLKVLEFETCDVGAFLVFGVPNAKYLLLASIYLLTILVASIQFYNLFYLSRVLSLKSRPKKKYNFLKENFLLKPINRENEVFLEQYQELARFGWPPLNLA